MLAEEWSPGSYSNVNTSGNNIFRSKINDILEESLHSTALWLSLKTVVSQTAQLQMVEQSWCETPLCTVWAEKTQLQVNNLVEECRNNSAKFMQQNLLYTTLETSHLDWTIQAQKGGGGVRAWYSNLTFTGSGIFKGNSVNYSGGVFRWCQHALFVKGCAYLR